VLPRLLKYADVGVSGTLRKILIWNLSSVKEMEEAPQSKGVEMVEIGKEGPKTLDLKP